jgi:multidrug efflux system membrane fusion protein
MAATVGLSAGGRFNSSFMSTGPGRRRAALVAALAALSLSLGGCGRNADAQGGPPPAPPVSVAPAVQRTVVDSEEFSGRLEASTTSSCVRASPARSRRSTSSTARSSGRATCCSRSTRGPFEAEAARAQSQVASTRAKAELAQSELARAKTLLDGQAISRQEYDQLSSGTRTAAADIQGAEAALRTARLNLEYTQVRAPIAGASRAPTSPSATSSTSSRC